MKFKDLFLEQDDNDWGNDEIHDFDADPEIDDVNNPPQPADPDEDNPEDEADGAMGVPPEPDRPARPKKLSATQQIKQKWLGQNPALTDFQMSDAIGFFRDRRDSLRPYHPYGYINPETNRHYINVPEITSIVERFPEMESTLTNMGTMMDLKNYPWDVMEYYTDMVRANNAIIDEENLVPGTKLPLEEQLQLAKERWSNPENQVLNEGGLIVYKIESKHESIALGSIQRVLKRMRDEAGNSRGSAYWCTTVPLNENGRSNLWTTYRPQRAFYYLWDQNKNQDDLGYCSSIQATERSNYTFVDLYNETTANRSWDSLTTMYPQLVGKENRFPWFGTTNKEKLDIRMDRITMRPGHEFYFGTLPKSYQHAYVDSGRHVTKVKAFLLMDYKTRKLYVDKTTKEDNDVQRRFLCDDPSDEFGILEALRLETKPENLYKYLEHVLTGRLGIPEGIMAIKKLIIGNNWRRWITDEITNQTLFALRTDKIDKNTRFGIMDIENAKYVKNPDFRVTSTETFVRVFNEEGVTRKTPIVLQKYIYTSGAGQQDPNQYFYVFTTTDAMTNKGSENYLKGRIFDGPEGEQFIEQQLAAGTLISLSRKRG